MTVHRRLPDEKVSRASRLTPRSALTSTEKEHLRMAAGPTEGLEYIALLTAPGHQTITFRVDRPLRVLHFVEEAINRRRAQR
jgi:hypothetical protein